MDRFGNDALMLAAGNGHPACVNALLSHCDAKQVNDQGETALMLASAQGAVQCVRALIASSDINAIEPENQDDACLIAMNNDQWECVDLLLQHLPESRANELYEHVGDGSTPVFDALTERRAIERAMGRAAPSNGAMRPGEKKKEGIERTARKKVHRRL